VVYERKNYKMFVNKFDEEDAGKESHLFSHMPHKLFGMPATKFSPTSFHFHHPSEHPVNGEHRDLSIHFSHNLVDAPNNDFKSYPFATHFSVEDYDRSISQEEIMTVQDFFETLDMGGVASSSLDDILGLA